MFAFSQLEIILSHTAKHPHFCIAYSGGVDSHVLLHAMAQLRDQNKEWVVRAVHINHGLHPNADSWEAHCREICTSLKIPLTTEKIQLDIKPGDSIEEMARNARYAAFEEQIERGENLLTAHTQNDQAETLLLQLLRGSGVKGLSAMPIKKPLGTGYLVRPLLECTRDDVITYARQNDLRWIEDDTNVEQRFNRNYLRHEIFPLLRRRWPEVFLMMSRSATHCAESAALLDELADLDLQTLSHENKLSVRALLLLSDIRRRNVLRRWIRQHGFRVPNKKHLEQIEKDVLLSAKDAKPIFSWGVAEIRRRGDLLSLSSR